MGAASDARATDGDVREAPAGAGGVTPAADHLGVVPTGDAAVFASEDRTSPAWRGEAGEVVFYRLTRKFVDSEQSVPEDAMNILYYTLAVGHHTGVIDCFEPVLGCDRALFDQIVAAFPEGEARRKLAGIASFGEITVDKTHVDTLTSAIDGVLAQLGWRGSAKAGMDVADPQFTLHARMCEWLSRLRGQLQDVRDETALYLVGRGQ